MLAKCESHHLVLLELTYSLCMVEHAQFNYLRYFGSRMKKQRKYIRCTRQYSIPRLTFYHLFFRLMRSMISYHSVFGNFPASSLTEDTELQSYAGFMLPISVNSSGTFVGAQHPFSKLTHPNLVVAAGGAVHGIDSILAQPLLYLEVEAIEVCEKHHYSSSINAELL